MDYVNLGSTGLKVSRLCLGTMTYGSKSWRDWVLEEQESRPFIQRALDERTAFLLFQHPVPPALGAVSHRAETQPRYFQAGRSEIDVVHIPPVSDGRSEERRVGKECRSR